MAFWGVEVKPRNPFTLKATESKRLHVSQATLGHGNGTGRSILQCNVGNKSPVLLCALSPDKVDCCQLNLEFDEADNNVIFSVLGPRSLHLTGYFLGRSTGFRPNDDDESESYGEDVGYSDKEKASSDDYDYSDSFINDEDPYVRGSHVSSTDDDEISIKEMAAKTKDKKKNGKGGRLIRKKFQVSDSDSDEILADESSNEDSVEVLNNGEHKIPKVHSLESPLPSRVTRSSKARRSTLENGEPNPKSENTSEARTHTHKTLDKREDKPLGDVKLSPIQKDCDVLSKTKKNKERFKSSAITNLDDGEGKSVENEKPATEKWGNKSSSDVLPSQNGDATPSKKKRKRDKREETSDVQKNQLECSETKKQAIDKNIEKEAGTQKPLESETSSNGVIIEDIAKTNLDGKLAVKGKKVSILYAGKLKDTGKLFESNLGEAPLRFRLGGEKVIEGLSIGVEGMRVGDKRRIIIPPSLGYSEQRLREDVPKNAWLVYEVEAVKIR